MKDPHEVLQELAEKGWYYPSATTFQQDLAILTNESQEEILTSVKGFIERGIRPSSLMWVLHNQKDLECYKLMIELERDDDFGKRNNGKRTKSETTGRTSAFAAMFE